jgi:glutathione reductase (NADPH)
VGAAHAVDQASRLHGHGLTAPPAIDWSDLMAFKRSFTDPVPAARERALDDAGIDAYHGTARFVNEHTLQVDNDTLKGEHIVLATGMHPLPLPFEGADLLTTSDEFLELDALPDEIIFVGGGYISMEFAHIARRAGAHARIIQRADHLLPPFDADCTDRLAAASRELGMDIHLNTDAVRIDKTNDGLAVTTRGPDGTEHTYTADLAVHGAGRVPNIEALDLENGNVDAGRGGITVNEYLQSPTNPRVYAAGDVADTPGLPLTPLSGQESHIVADNLLGDTPHAATYGLQPSAAFTLPPLATVGLTVEEAKSDGRDVRITENDLSGWYSYRRIQADTAYAKVLVDAETDAIVGAHLIGEQAPELINLFTLAIRHDMTPADIRDTTFAYPTHGSDLKYMV